MLTTEDLEHRNIRPRGVGFLGCFPIDDLPTPPRDSLFSFIGNTDAANERGEHWFAIIQPDPSIHHRRLLLFDPFALPLHRLVEPLRSWIGSDLVYTSPYPIQPIWSTSCGAFCVFVLEKLPAYDFNLERLVRGEFDEDNALQNHQKILSWWWNRRSCGEV